MGSDPKRRIVLNVISGLGVEEWMPHIAQTVHLGVKRIAAENVERIDHLRSID